jgi:biopolymer transport protein ExbD
MKARMARHKAPPEANSRPYRDVVAVVDAAKGAGVQRVGIVTESMRKSG